MNNLIIAVNLIATGCLITWAMSKTKDYKIDNNRVNVTEMELRALERYIAKLVRENNLKVNKENS